MSMCKFSFTFYCYSTTSHRRILYFLLSNKLLYFHWFYKPYFNQLSTILPFSKAFSIGVICIFVCLLLKWNVQHGPFTCNGVYFCCKYFLLHCLCWLMLLFGVCFCVLAGDYAGFPGCGLLRLHSTYRHDLKIYASEEGRVQMTAAAFAKVDTSHPSVSHTANHMD